MAFLDELKRAQVSPVSVYHQFLLKNRNSPGCVHAFFEGHGDQSFYTGFLRRYIPHPKCLITYICGNKANVYKTYSKIMLASPQGIVLFFVDKDFSDILNESFPQADNIYITDYYSIENYLVSEDMLVRIWNEIFRFPKAIMDISSTQNKFQVELEHFYAFILPIIAWIVYLRRTGLNPNLNNIKLAKIFSINDELTLEKRKETKQTGEIIILESMCGVTTPVGSQTDIASIATELAILLPKAYVRGKFEIWFFVKFIEKLAHLLQHIISEKGGNFSVKPPINEDNIIEVLGPRLQIPPTLEKFLHQNIPM